METGAPLVFSRRPSQGRPRHGGAAGSPSCRALWQLLPTESGAVITAVVFITEFVAVPYIPGQDGLRVEACAGWAPWCWCPARRERKRVVLPAPRKSGTRGAVFASLFTWDPVVPRTRCPTPVSHTHPFRSLPGGHRSPPRALPAYSKDSQTNGEVLL